MVQPIADHDKNQEMQVTRLQDALDRIENILREDTLPDDIKIHQALDIIAES